MCIDDIMRRRRKIGKSVGKGEGDGVRYESCEIYDNNYATKNKSKSKSKIKNIDAVDEGKRFFNSPGKKAGQSFLLHNP